MHVVLCSDVIAEIPKMLTGGCKSDAIPDSRPQGPVTPPPIVLPGFDVVLEHLDAGADPQAAASTALAGRAALAGVSSGTLWSETHANSVTAVAEVVLFARDLAGVADAFAGAGVQTHRVQLLRHQVYPAFCL